MERGRSFVPSYPDWLMNRNRLRSKAKAEDRRLTLMTFFSQSETNRDSRVPSESVAVKFYVRKKVVLNLSLFELNLRTCWFLFAIVWSQNSWVWFSYSTITLSYRQLNFKLKYIFNRLAYVSSVANCSSTMNFLNLISRFWHFESIFQQRFELFS